MAPLNWRLIVTSPPAIPLTPLCIAKGESLLRVFSPSVEVITRYRGDGPVEIPSSSTWDPFSCFCYGIHKKVCLLIRPFLQNPLSPDWPNKGHRHLCVAGNYLLVIALAIECNLLTNSIECYNSPSLVISTQQWNNLEKESMANWI